MKKMNDLTDEQSKQIINVANILKNTYCNKNVCFQCPCNDPNGMCIGDKLYAIANNKTEV